MAVLVQTLTGKQMGFQVNLAMTTLELKQAIEDKEGIPTDQQRLISSGCQLDDDETLGFCSTKEGPIVHLLLRLRGGCFTADTSVLVPRTSNETANDSTASTSPLPPTTKRIADVAAGDMVLSMDLGTGKLVERAVLKTFELTAS